MEHIGLEVHSTEIHIAKHEGEYLMEITRNLRELLFVMHLERELDLQRRIGDKPNMKHAVHVAMSETTLTTGVIKEEGL